MAIETIGQIGSAGRSGAQMFVTNYYYDAAYDVSKQMREKYGVKRYTSGGAGFMDHLAIRMLLDGHIDWLKVFVVGYPGKKGFEAEHPDYRMKAYEYHIDTANFYHDQMKEKLGIDSYGQFLEAMEKGMMVEHFPSFYDRNIMVAKTATRLVAFTEHKDGPESGGTASTIRAFRRLTGGPVHHFYLGDL